MNAESYPTDVHAAVFELLPWWVNGTLDGREAAMVEEHLRRCERCQSEAAVQRKVRDAMRREASNVEHAPQASFERLWSRIEELDRDVPRAGAGPALTPPTHAGRSSFGREHWRLAAGVMLAIGAASIFGTVYWRSSPQDDAALFHTATSDATTGGGPRIRAVFADATTVEELAAITRAAGLTVVAGPTEAGVYTLRPADRNVSAATLDDALHRLRDDPRVRFAEPVGSRAGPQ